MGQAHGITSTTRVDADTAAYVARVMRALGTPSRVRILGCLREGSATVSELTAAVEMEQPAVSHQLRILRDLDLVKGSRNGRHTVYDLCDHHVAMLLDEALRHIEHLRQGGARALHPLDGDASPTTDEGAPMTDEHTHETPHTHEHSHDDGTTHVHPHTEHDHDHLEHEHDHNHDGETHSHPHVHEEGLEEVHEHEHA